LVMSAEGRGFRRRSGFTIPYQDLRMPGTTHWCFWFGGPAPYQSLPTRTYILLGDFGLEAGGITNPYHAAILA